MKEFERKPLSGLPTRSRTSYDVINLSRGKKGKIDARDLRHQVGKRAIGLRVTVVHAQGHGEQGDLAQYYRVQDYFQGTLTSIP